MRSFAERMLASPVAATVVAVLLIVVGVLVIVYPGLLAWIAGIGLGLTGIAVLVTVYVPRDRFET